MASGWDKPLATIISQVDNDKRRLVSALTLYAQGQFKRMSPVLTGQLRRSFTSSFSRDGLTGITGSNLPYAIPIWVEGHSERLSPGAVDLVVANMQQLPITLFNN